jgi:predicted DNA-binding transcriptional regulator AlpA
MDQEFDLQKNRVISIQNVAELLGISQPTLRRQCVAGEGPKLIRLSSRRIGVRVKDLDLWLAQRAGEVQKPRKH